MLKWYNRSAGDLNRSATNMVKKESKTTNDVMHLGLWRYWIFPYRGDAATNIAVWRLIARTPPPPPPPPIKKLMWSHLCKCMVCCSKASARCRATAHCSRSQISLITWRDVLSATLTASARARRCTQQTEQLEDLVFKLKQKTAS